MSLEYYFRALLSIGFIVGLLYVIYQYLLKFKKNSTQGNLSIKDRLWFDKGKGLIVVDYLEHRLLLGVADKQINLIKELPKDDEPPAKEDLT